MVSSIKPVVDKNDIFSGLPFEAIEGSQDLQLDIMSASVTKQIEKISAKINLQGMLDPCIILTSKLYLISFIYDLFRLLSRELAARGFFGYLIKFLDW